MHREQKQINANILQIFKYNPIGRSMTKTYNKIVAVSLMVLIYIFCVILILTTQWYWIHYIDTYIYINASRIEILRWLDVEYYFPRWIRHILRYIYIFLKINKIVVFLIWNLNSSKYKYMNDILFFFF